MENKLIKYTPRRNKRETTKKARLVTRTGFEPMLQP